MTDCQQLLKHWGNCTILDICLLHFVHFWVVFFVHYVQVMFTKKAGTILMFILLQAFRDVLFHCVILCVYLFWRDIIKCNCNFPLSPLALLSTSASLSFCCALFCLFLSFPHLDEANSVFMNAMQWWSGVLIPYCKNIPLQVKLQNILKALKSQVVSSQLRNDPFECNTTVVLLCSSTMLLDYYCSCISMQVEYHMNLVMVE